MPQLSHKHHYVPQWYQSGFLSPGATAFTVLDLHPCVYGASTGRRSVARDRRTAGPRRCFFDRDLYTTRLLGQPNDDIERYLFGAIDRRGEAAIKAFIVRDFVKLRTHYVALYEYMDAQRLRTPKGLDWLRRTTNPKTHEHLMVILQHLRRMHCALWMEGVLELVSATNSDEKFLLTDHPVTVYNPGCFPASPACLYPNDPNIPWLGSQTVFPLDRDTLFILTHLEYAKAPSKVNPVHDRTNSRLMGSTMARYDQCIREREFSAEQVARANLILKQRAKRYVAAENAEWLYPERRLKERAWNRLGRDLLPPRHKLHGFGGELFIGMKDGSVYYQDAYGRRPKDGAEQDLRRKQAEQIRLDVEMLLRKAPKK